MWFQNKIVILHPKSVNNIKSNLEMNNVKNLFMGVGFAAVATLSAVARQVLQVYACSGGFRQEDRVEGRQERGDR